MQSEGRHDLHHAWIEGMSGGAAGEHAPGLRGAGAAGAGGAEGGNVQSDFCFVAGFVNFVNCRSPLARQQIRS